MASYWKWIIGIIVTLIVAGAIYCFCLTFQKKDEQSSTITIYRRPQITQKASETTPDINQSLSNFDKDLQDTESLIQNPTLDEISQDLTNF